MSHPSLATFTPVCRVDEIDRESGVTALVDGQAVAVFKTYDGRVYALGNYDPFSRASVLARGIVGTRTQKGPEGEESVDFVASPIHKQAFALATGECLDDATVRVPSYAVEVADGMVLVGAVLAGSELAGAELAGAEPVKGAGE